MPVLIVDSYEKENAGHMPSWKNTGLNLVEMDVPS
jgi:hypothetical protein